MMTVKSITNVITLYATGNTMSRVTAIHDFDIEYLENCRTYVL